MAGHKKSARKRRKRKLILFIIELIILAAIIGVLYFYQKLDQVDTQQMDESQITVNPVTEETEITFQGYTTIAIFGLDNRTQGVYESGNSDSIMIMNINNDTKEMSLVSVYRDTYLNVASATAEEVSFFKCNSAYARGGAEQAITMLNRNLDLDIDNYVSVDFTAVADAIDVLGGVDIEIEDEEELYWLNKYISDMHGEMGTENDQVDSPGLQTLNGIQAVAYCRIRYTSGNDYKRAERQRRVFSQMAEKAKNASLAQVSGLIDAVFPKIQTNLSKKDMLTMASAMLDYDMSSSFGFPMERTTRILSSSGDTVIPCTLESNVIELHKMLFGTEDYEPSETVKEYSEYIIDDTGVDEEDATEDSFTDTDDFTGTQDDSTEQDTESEDSEE